MVLSKDGKPLQELVGGNHLVRLADFMLPTPYRKQCASYIEIASNDLFGAGMEKCYKLEECCLVMLNKGAWNLIHDVTYQKG